MAEVSAVEPVMYFVAVLYREEDAYASARQHLVERWGELAFEGPSHPFDVTDFYAPEMGAGLVRRLIAFADLKPPDFLPDAKHGCNELEKSLALGASRRVNLDIGYLDHNKIVLASVKAAGQKIYLGAGVYADLVGRYKSGRYQPFEWTFPDFRDGRYDDDLVKIRQLYKVFRRSADDSKVLQPPNREG